MTESATLVHCELFGFVASSLNGVPSVVSPMAITTFPVNPVNGHPTLIDPNLLSQYTG